MILHATIVLASWCALSLQDPVPQPVGKPGEWKDTVALCSLNGHLWTIDKAGNLSKTDKAGVRTLVGTAGAWKGTVVMAASEKSLWTIDTAGNLVKTETDGSRTKIGADGQSKDTVVMAVLDHVLWTIDKSGSLCSRDMQGKKTWIGALGDWANTTLMAGWQGQLWTIERTGTLYKTDQKGKWEGVGKEGDWANTVAMVPWDAYLLTVEASGTLYKTDKGGRWKQIGKDGGWARTLLMEVLDGHLWTITRDGSLFKTPLAAGGGAATATDKESYCPATEGRKRTYVWEDDKEDVVTCEGTKTVKDVECIVLKVDYLNGVGTRMEYFGVTEQGLVTYGTDLEEDEDASMENPMVVIKAGAKKGDKWEHESEGGYKTSFECLGEEEVTVPAGKYRCLKIVFRQKIAGEPSVTTEWYAKGVGLVKYESVTGAGPGAAKSHKLLKSAK